MTDKEHIYDVQPATVDEHFQLLLNCKEEIDSNFVKVKADNLPEWYDEKLFKKGQQLCMDYLLAMVNANLSGLIAVLAIPDILEVLVDSKNNITVPLSLKRYAQTILHIYALHKTELLSPDSLWFKAINAIRWRHSNASKKRIQKGLNGIYQKDMAITQFGFIGYVFLVPEKLGMTNTEKYMLGFNHYWQVIGYLLGISNRMNICRKTIAETRELCKRIQNEIIAKHLYDQHPKFMEYVTNVTKGIWYMDVSINHDTFLYLTYDLTGLKYKKPLSWYSYLNLKYRQFIIYMYDKPYIGFIIRKIYNKIVVITFWMIVNFPILAWISFGKEKKSLTLYPNL
ncbi:uncharacterized protein LOC108002023 [Apis cerana]|uniref:uncharacterized protein LOC108002023 n=1 Tax=Apis cerana TaxID=7461 RepID=UPI002B22C192|nr:uncharacterized protein LOC108002023 [Apis cerana]